MTVKACPDCRSQNTRQMDFDKHGNKAYCLSCYNTFHSVIRVKLKTEKPEIKTGSKDDKYLKKIEDELRYMKRRVLQMESMIESMKA